MADIRIKDLTTTASSTASDDFIAVDGTTNGTRKLNAFSPTFGGNATVTGTLTANSTSSFADRITLRKDVAGNVEQLIDNRNTAGGEVIYLSEDGLSTEYAYIARYNSAHATTSKRKALEFGVNGTGAFYNFASGVLKVSDTTASTTTSSGALVVSGGVGVGNEVSVYGRVRAQLGLHADGNVPAGLASAYQVDVQAGTSRDILSFGDSSRAGLIRGEQDGSGRATLKFGRYTASTFAEYLRITGVAATDAVLSVYGTTASTSTSSGALVVSGGVGVAGAIYAGGALFTVSGAGFNTPDWRFYQSGTSGYVRDLVNGQMALQFVSGNASTIQVYATGTQDSTSTTSGALVSSGGLGVAGAVNAGTFYGLVDGVTAPATAGGYARIYVDSADGDLKVKFGDGTVKTIATDS